MIDVRMWMIGVAGVAAMGLVSGCASIGVRGPALGQGVDVLVGSVDHAEASLAGMTTAAETVAKRWVDGAELCVAGDASFVDEAFYRAGGLIGIRAVDRVSRSGYPQRLRWREVPDDAVVLYGLHRSVEPNMRVFDEVRQLAKEGRTVVLFGSSQWPVCRKILAYCRARLPLDCVLLVDTELPVDTRLEGRHGVRFGDAGPAATAVHQWAFTNELISACTRLGKMPALWPSLKVPDWRVWEAKYKGIVFHDDVSVAPIGRGVLARAYLATLRAQVEACRGSEAQLREAATVVRAATRRGGSVYLVVGGHLLPAEAALPPELSNWLLVQRSWRWNGAARETVERGDAVVWLGYLDWPADQAKWADEAGATFVGVSVREPTPAELVGKDVVWVGAPWAYPDAVVTIDGYELLAAPTSGVVQAALLWGLAGEVIDTSARRTPMRCKGRGCPLEPR